MQRLSVVGLGKLGASMAAAMADRGHHVIGVDVDRQAVEALRDGRAPVHETNLESLIAANRARLTATTDFVEATNASDMTFVIVPTPTDDQGGFSLRFVGEAFDQIGRALAQKRDYHVVVLTSTVLPGACRTTLVPILERRSGKRCGVDFGFCYSPEFVALGTVIRDFLNPDFLLVGEFDARSGDALASAYDTIVTNRAPVARMSVENAELAKISLNAYVTMKITFANLLADLCERLPGGDVDVVSAAIGLDSRIGRRYLTGGLGFGGPCFPRDNVALAFLASSLGATSELPSATHLANRQIPGRIADAIGRLVPAGSTVAILGLSYKPATKVIEESQAIDIARMLADRGYRIVAFDPLAGSEARAQLGARVDVVESIAACLAPADAVLVANADPTFARLTASDFQRPDRDIIVVDLWRLLARELAHASGIRYIARGRSLAPVNTAAAADTAAATRR